MTDPTNLIEDKLIALADDLHRADVTLRNAAEQLKLWRRLATTAYDAFQDLYEIWRDGGKPEDFKRIKCWKAEVDECRKQAKKAEEEQP